MKALNEEEEQEIVVILKEYIPEASSIHLDYKISNLGISSMDFITLIFDVEDKYSIKIKASEIDMEETLRVFLCEKVLTSL